MWSGCKAFATLGHIQHQSLDSLNVFGGISRAMLSWFSSSSNEVAEQQQLQAAKVTSPYVQQQ